VLACAADVRRYLAWWQFVFGFATLGCKSNAACVVISKLQLLLLEPPEFQCYSWAGCVAPVAIAGSRQISPVSASVPLLVSVALASGGRQYKLPLLEWTDSVFGMVHGTVMLSYQ